METVPWVLIVKEVLVYPQVEGEVHWHKLNILCSVVVPYHGVRASIFSQNQDVDLESSHIDKVTVPERYSDFVGSRDHTKIGIAPIIVKWSNGVLNLSRDVLNKVIQVVVAAWNVEFTGS